ncbi:hypothetical protein PHYBOEH_008625 [Phytophthora boehmeriae]|uniref:Uncharacterized protein n=1 Tax=Phytophthora boehmeriae TaxID=109152 RepID=A0A8T1VZF8_9STRA|nr:hypothetical protein PHYBOEH_008625 [Phytophthora boehmeriae]
MVQLHMPRETEVELEEFLEGAKRAAAMQLTAVNSKEFEEFAAGVATESSIAEELQDYCTPRFFESIKDAAARTLMDRNLTMELQKIEIEDAVVANVQYAQLTQTQYEAQMAGLTKLPRFWSRDATIEYMQIIMQTRSSETTKMTLIGQEECLVLQDNARTWTFGSKVGSPDELAWQIVDTFGMNNAAKQLSRTVHHRLATRSLSSSSGDGNAPRFERGLALAAGLWQRTTDQLPKLDEYEERKVFPSSLGTMGNVWLFLQLQLPAKTQIDLVEFLQGARMATEAKLRATNCVEFPKFLAEEQGSSSEAADSLRSFTTPACYNEMALQVKTNYLRGRRFVDCEQMTIERAQVSKVFYQRLTEQEYTDMVELRKLPDAVSPDATIEHLRLHVDVATVEDLNLVFLDQKKTFHVQQQNVYRVAFESRVTSPEEVDWHIDSMRLVDKSAVERSPATPFAATDDETSK